MKIGFLKRTASFLLAVILMFTAVPFTAQAQEDNDSGGELENINSSRIQPGGWRSLFIVGKQRLTMALHT